jgi:hypothetical protein
MRSYLFVIAMSVVTCSFSSLMGTTYLLDTIGYEQEKLSLIEMINFPIGIVASIFIGKFIYERPLKRFLISCIFVTFSDIICVNLLYYNYETLKGFKFDA